MTQASPERDTSVSDPTVSVIVPVFNYGAFLPHALDSIQRQTLSHWECIIVDDGSTDDSAAIGRTWARDDGRFRYEYQPNAGPSAARNRGIEQSRAPFIQFLDADDLLQTRKLELHSRYLQDHPDVDVVYGPVRYFTDDPSQLRFSLGGKLSSPRVPGVSGQGREILDLLLDRNIMPINAALFRREAFDRAGKFEPTSRGCEDWDLLIRCAIVGCRFRFVEFPDSFGLVRSHETSASRDDRRMTMGLIAAAKRFPDTPAFHHWQPTTRDRLPALYEGALGIDDVMAGHRVRGIRRLLIAASSARTFIAKVRWFGYAALAPWMPRAWFFRLASIPLPEPVGELMSRIGSILRRRRKGDTR